MNKSLNWNKITHASIIDKGTHYETLDGRVITWSSFDAVKAQQYLAKWAIKPKKKK